MITHQELLDNFDYCSETGILRRRMKRGKLKIAGNIDSYGYIVMTFNYATYKAHRLIWLYVNGVWPENEIDHVNHIRNDNRLSNLRETTHRENHKNKSIPRKNKSGCIGVYLPIKGGKWQVYIKPTDKAKYLGSFTSKQDAIAARKAAEVKYGFHENHGQ